MGERSATQTTDYTGYDTTNPALQQFVQGLGPFFANLFGSPMGGGNPFASLMQQTSPEQQALSQVQGLIQSPNFLGQTPGVTPIGLQTDAGFSLLGGPNSFGFGGRRETPGSIAARQPINIGQQVAFPTGFKHFEGSELGAIVDQFAAGADPVELARQFSPGSVAQALMGRVSSEGVFDSDLARALALQSRDDLTGGSDRDRALAGADLGAILRGEAEAPAFEASNPTFGGARGGGQGFPQNFAGGGFIPLDLRNRVQFQPDPFTGSIIGAALPGFQQNLQASLGNIAATSPSTFNTAFGLEQADTASQAIRDFNLFAGQAARQGQELGLQRFATELGAQGQRQQLATQAALGTQSGQTGLQQSQVARETSLQQAALQALLQGGALAGQAQQRFINPTLQLMMAGLGLVGNQQYMPTQVTQRQPFSFWHDFFGPVMGMGAYLGGQAMGKSAGTPTSAGGGGGF